MGAAQLPHKSFDMSESLKVLLCKQTGTSLEYHTAGFEFELQYRATQQGTTFFYISSNVINDSMEFTELSKFSFIWKVPHFDDGPKISTIVTVTRKNATTLNCPAVSSWWIGFSITRSYKCHCVIGNCCCGSDRMCYWCMPIGMTMHLNIVSNWIQRHLKRLFGQWNFPICMSSPYSNYFASNNNFRFLLPE